MELEAPSYELFAWGIQGTISSTLNITAGREGGPVVWKVEEVAEVHPNEVSEDEKEVEGESRERETKQADKTEAERQRQTYRKAGRQRQTEG